MIVLQIFEWLATFVEILLGVLVIVKVLSEKNVKWKECMIMVCIITIIIWCINQYQLFSTVTSLIAMGCWVISTSVLYKVNPFDALSLSIDYVILVYIIDFLSISILGVIFREKQMADMLTCSFSFMRVGFLCLSKGMLFFVCYYLKRYFAQFQFKNWKACMIMISGSAIVYYYVKNTFLESNANVTFVWILLLALALSVNAAWGQYMNLLQEKREKAVIAERNLIIAENYENMIRNYRENQMFYHNLKNQQLVIENYLKNEDYEKAQAYMRELRFSDYLDPVKKWTGIDGLDVLLACKRKTALDLKIEIEITAEVIHLNISQQDLITLVGNAFDNAIEACKEMESKNKWIRISIRNIREMTFFKIVNSYERIPEIREGRVLSTKKDKNLHGFGLVSMRAIVNEYEGNMSVDYEKGVFSVVVSFFN